jgi:hypothetical protein
MEQEQNDQPEGGERLFERLSAAGRELAPVGYRFLAAQPPESADQVRVAESRFYRASGYVCWRFHRPLSKWRADVP